jgi:hypothetical protein
MPMTDAEREQMLKACKKAEEKSRIKRGGPNTLEHRETYEWGFEDGWNTVFETLEAMENGVNAENES